jgi:hypothetical protein
MKKGVKRKIKNKVPITKLKTSIKSYKKTIIRRLVLSLILLVLILLITHPKTIFTGQVISSPAGPNNCTNTAISSIWDSIFQESSQNIVIFTNDTASNFSGCDRYIAYKNNSNMFYVLYGMNEERANMVYAMKANVSYNEIDIIKSNSSYYVNNEFGGFLVFYMFLPTNETRLRTNNITNADYAASEFVNTFKINFGSYPHTWKRESTYGFEENYNLYTSQINESNANLATIMATNIYESIFKNIYAYMNGTFAIIQPPLSSCTPNWGEFNIDCQINDKKIIYYLDLKFCNNETGKPINKTEYCDYDYNGLIGNFSNATLTRVNPKININGTELNYSLNYTNIEKVEFIYANKTIIEFNWNFSIPLNLENITIEKQDSSSERGYLIINGIDSEKAVILDRLNSNSSAVCIKNQEIASISNISNGCNESGEYLVSCPGTNSSYQCNITDSTHFKILGLTHSAVTEMMNNQSQQTVCTPLDCISLGKNCGSWIETSCNTTLNCGSCINNQICNPSGICENSCTPNWNCTEYKPKECPENQTQTRDCQDKNNCGISEGKPQETQSCEYIKTDNSKMIIIIGTLALIILITVLVIILIINRKKNSVAPTMEINSSNQIEITQTKETTEKSDSNTENK